MENNVATEVAAQGLPQPFIIGITIIGVMTALLLAHWLLRIVLSKKSTGIEKKIYLYPLPVRAWHWINLTMFVVLLFTGVGAWIKLWGMKELLINIHIAFASVYVFLWVFLIAYNMLGNGKNYMIRPNILAGVIKQTAYYLIGVMKGDKEPFKPSVGNKFNPLQQTSYAFVIYILIPLFILSGILQMMEPIHGFMMRVHIYVCAFIAALFAINHLYMVLSSRSLKNMIDGYDRYTE